MPEPHFDMTALVGEAVTTLGYIPAVLPAAVAERVFDALSHHRLGVIKDAAKMPGGRRAQKFVASRMYRYSRLRATTINEVKGEGFAAEPNPGAFGGEGLELLEEGGLVAARGVMAIGLARLPAEDRANLQFIRGRALLVRMVERKRGKSIQAVRADIFPLKRSRRQRPMLGYYRRWEVVEPKAMARLERDVQTAMTVAGQRGLEGRLSLAEAKRRAYSEAYAAVIIGGPGQAAMARRAGREAAAAVRRDSLGR